MYLDRIEAYDKKGPLLNAIVMVNPNALATADALDRGHTLAFEVRTVVRATLRWREMDSNFLFRGTKAVDFRSIQENPSAPLGDREGAHDDIRQDSHL
jgi:hypothetical protein